MCSFGTEGLKMYFYSLQSSTWRASAETLDPCPIPGWGSCDWMETKWPTTSSPPTGFTACGCFRSCTFDFAPRRLLNAACISPNPSLQRINWTGLLDSVFLVQLIVCGPEQLDNEAWKHREQLWFRLAGQTRQRRFQENKPWKEN